jgi:hypothetical protein
LFRLLPLLDTPESLEVIDELWDDPMTTSCYPFGVLRQWSPHSLSHEHAVVDLRQSRLNPPGTSRALWYASYDRVPHWPRYVRAARRPPGVSRLHSCCAARPRHTHSRDTGSRSRLAAGRPQRKAFRDACHQLGEVVVTQAREQVQSQVLVHPESPVPPESRSILEAWALARAQAADVIDVVKRALDPILMNLQVQIVEIPMTPTGDVPSFQIPSQTPEPQTGSSALAAMANTKDSSPGPADVGSFLRPQLPPPLMLQTSLSPPAGLATAVGDLGLSPV